MKTVAQRIIWLLSKSVNIIFAAILFLLFLIGTYAIWDTQLVYSGASSDKWETYRPIDSPEGFDSLREKNKDVIGWLNVYGTHIDYPILYSQERPDYYLTHDALCAYSAAGSLFVEAPNKPDFSDYNTFIFGHHMDKDAMFGEIEHFQDREFLEKHAYGTLDYFDADGKLQHKGLDIVGFISCDAYDTSIYTKNVAPQNQAGYLKNLIARANPQLQVAYNNEHLVLLSTCASEGTNARNVLLCYLTDTIQPDPYPKTVNMGFGIDKLKGLFGFPWLGWVGLLLLICLLILAIIWAIDSLRERKGKDKDHSLYRSLK